MSYRESIDFGEKIIRCLGLPRGTKRFELHCGVDEIITVKCEYYPYIDDNSAKEFVSILSEYELRKKEVK